MTPPQAVATKRWLQAVGFASMLALIMAVTGMAKIALADSFVQSFNASGPVDIGWVVAIDKKDSNSVVAAPASDSSQMYGVVIDPTLAAVTIQNPGQQVFVATSGSYQVLVSSEDGSIKPGDYISMSSINGIAAKASPDESSVLGRALTSFDGKTNVITTSGSAAIGRITVNIEPGRNPLSRDSVAVPSALRTLGDSVAGKTVTALRIYSALAVFIMTAVIAACLLWVGVRSGMIAIGRNPLSRHSIIRSLSEVIVISILIFIAGLLGVYLLLRL
jgi:hypothetical protein